jgi:hypothetical protein
LGKVGRAGKPEKLAEPEDRAAYLIHTFERPHSCQLEVLLSISLYAGLESVARSARQQLCDLGTFAYHSPKKPEEGEKRRTTSEKRLFHFH